jgi:adenylosuccinate synthase
MQIIPAEVAMRVLREARNPVMEGAQGVLLDEWHGFHPFTTWSTTTPKNAHELLAECGFRGEVEVTGILRSYTTRHGAGPFVTESPDYTYISPGEHNQLNEWQGTFRSGPLDGVLLRYAVKCVNYVGGLTNLAITHMDILRDRGTLLICDSYGLEGKEIRQLEAQNRQDLAHQERLTLLLQRVKPKQEIEIRAKAAEANEDGAKDLTAYVSSQTKLPVSYLSYGPKPGHKQRI